LTPEELPATAGDNTMIHKLPRKIRYLYVAAHNATSARGIISVSLSFQNTDFVVGAHMQSILKDPLIVEIPGELPVNEAVLKVLFEDCIAADVLQAFLSYEMEV
jgi:hypothetical protein